MNGRRRLSWATAIVAAVALGAWLVGFRSQQQAGVAVVEDAPQHLDRDGEEQRGGPVESSRGPDLDLVVELEGEPIRGARVCALVENTSLQLPRWCRATIQGGMLPLADLKRLRPGMVVVVSGGEMCPQKVTLQSGTNRVAMAACETVAVRGRIVDVWGGAVEHAVVTAVQGVSTGVGWSAVADDGKFSLELPATVRSSIRIQVSAERIEDPVLTTKTGLYHQRLTWRWSSLMWNPRSYPATWPWVVSRRRTPWSC